MKKIAICAVALLGSAIGAKAQSFNLVKQGGGPNGYARVEQSTDANGNTDMSCTNPGYDQCTVVNPPSAPPNTPKAGTMNNIIGAVNGQIKNGAYSGEAIYNGYISVWSGTDINNYVLTVKPQ